MSQISLTRSDASIANSIWPKVLICICVLMAVTVSPPEDLKTGNFETASILPPTVIKLLKTAGRGATILVLAYSLYLVWKNPRRWKTARVLFPIIAFLVFAMCSVAWSASMGTSLIQAASFSILIALAHLIGTIWNGEEDTCRLLKCCSIVLFVISSSLVILHFIKPELGALTRRSGGVFHSTSAGATASLGIVILFASFVIWGWSWTRCLIVPATIAHLSSLMIGGNRLSLAVMLVVCTILFLTMAHKAIVAFTGMAFVIALVAYTCIDPGLMLFDVVAEKFSLFSSQGQTSLQLSNFSGRTEMWAKIWNSYLESPWIGHGYFMTSKTGHLLVWGEWGNWTAHNFYLQLLVTTGAVGAALFLLGIANVVLGVVLRVGSSDKSAHRLAVFLMAIYTWFVGWSLLNVSVLGPLQPESVVFAVTLGLGTAISIHSNISLDTEGISPPVISQGETP